MGYGDTVPALLDLYAKCLDLLRKSKMPPNEKQGGSNLHATLSQSLRDDRARVQQAYSSRLSETGSRLTKGDKHSRSALRRIFGRLKSALAVLFGAESGVSNVSNDGRPLVTYDALRALSNQSRVDAIYAIDTLSERLSQKQASRPSRRTNDVRKSNTSRKASQPKQSREPRKKVPAEASWQRHGNTEYGKHTRHGNAASNERNTHNGRPSLKSQSNSHSEVRERQPAGKASPTHAPRDQRCSAHKRRREVGTTSITSSRDLDPHHTNWRVSVITTSSASTKLGEIPGWKVHGTQNGHPRGAGAAVPPVTTNGSWDWDGLEYNVRPMYPVRPFYTPRAPEPAISGKRGFWGRFRGT